MRANYEQIHEDTAYPLNAAFNEDEDHEVEPPDAQLHEAARDTTIDETPTNRGVSTTT